MHMFASIQILDIKQLRWNFEISQFIFFLHLLAKLMFCFKKMDEPDWVKDSAKNG